MYIYDETRSHRILHDIFKEDGVIKQVKSDYVPRPSQIEAAHMYLDSLSNGDHQILEGPCGFGKTFAYLIPTFIKIYESMETNSDNHPKVVIATSGISLQEQLYHKDIPIVQEIFNRLYSVKLKSCILKGKANFACPLKMSEMDDVYEAHPQVKKIKEMCTVPKNGGDFSSLDFVPSKDVLEQVSCTMDGECKGRKCPMFSECFYQKHKAKLSEAHIIVTNYHMLFTSMRISGAILPSFNYLICDEAHEMADIFRNSNEISYKGVSYLTSRVKAIENKVPVFKQYIESVQLVGENKDPYSFSSFIHDLKRETETYFGVCESKFFSQGYDTIRMVDNSIQGIDHSRIYTIIKELTNYMSDILTQIEIELDDNSEDEELSTIQSMLTPIVNKLYEYKMIFRMVTNIDSDDCKNYAIYYEKYKRSDDSYAVGLSVKPVKVDEQMYTHLFSDNNIESTLLTSATLSTGGNFDYIKDQLGVSILESRNEEMGEDVLDSCKRKVNEMIGESPFNLTEQQLWYMPNPCIDANDKMGRFDAYSIKNVLELIEASNGGALILTTSYKAMNMLHENIVYKFGGNPKMTILKQGDKPRHMLVEDMAKNKHCVLVATKSFFTGVDIKGDGLRLLVIDKFPFESPNDPIVQKLRVDPGAFYKYSVPSMIIALKQAVGRGVRSTSDKCVICLLDGRLSTARYKKSINNSFNYKKNGTRSIDDVIAFVSDMGIEPYEDPSFSYSEDDDDDLPF